MSGERVGFIGLGAIGRPIAVHVARAFETAVWSRTAGRAQEFAAETGATVVNETADLVDGCDTVLTCLPTSKEVREVVQRAADQWRAGHVLVDLTSGDPNASQEMGVWLAHRGAGFVDAPVSGGVGGAVKGTLTVMLGGEEPWVTRAERVVNPFAGKVVHVGPVGAGHAVKAANQALLAVNILAAGEGLAALVKYGVSGAKALEVINSSSGRSNVTENLIPERVLTRSWPRTFRLALMDKDVGIALDLIEREGVPSDVTAVVKRLLAEARAALGEEADHVEAIKVIERAAGVEVR